MPKRWIIATALFVANATVIGVIWWHGSSSFITSPFPGSVWIAFGRLTGLLLQLALLLQLVLIARIPPLERAFGFVSMNRLHRLAGGWFASLLVIHPLLLSIGYGGSTIAAVWTQFISFLTGWSYVLIALIGTILLLTAAIFSIRAIRRRLPYEVWHLVHVVMYAAAVTIFFHQIVAGDFAGVPLALAYWVALNAIVLGLVLVHRVVQPIFLFARHRFVVQAIVKETDDVTSVIIGGRRMERFCFDPGQHAKLSFFARGLIAPHPFSFSAIPNGQTIRFSIKHLGDFTRRVPSLAPGTRVLVDGPLGAFTLRRASAKKILLIAGGIGITPIYSILASLKDRDADAVLLYANRMVHNAALRTDIEHLVSRTPGIRVVFFNESDEVLPLGFERGRIDESAIRRFVPDVLERDVFVCGPPRMMDAVEGVLRKIGIPKRRIHDEKFEL